jgi:hypothetical protein
MIFIYFIFGSCCCLFIVQQLFPPAPNFFSAYGCLLFKSVYWKAMDRQVFSAFSIAFQKRKLLKRTNTKLKRKKAFVNR